MSSNHRLGRGLPGYLILFAPTLSCLSVNNGLVSCLRNRCSITYQAFHRYMSYSANLQPYSRKISFNGSSQVELRAFTTDLTARLRTL